MALVVDSTPISPANNSYVSLAASDEYVATRVPDAAVQAAWEAITDELKGAYLVNASRTLDALCDWIGDKYSADQGLRWPRSNAYVDGFLLSSTTFPEAVMEATVEMAVWSMTNEGEVSTNSNAQYDSIKVGPIAIDFNEGADIPAKSYYPDIVAMLLRDYGGITPPDSASGNVLKQVYLVRT